MDRGKLRACLGAVFVNIMWGLSFIGSKSAMRAGFGTFSLITVRFVTASLALGIAACVLKKGLRIKARDIPLILLSSATGITIYFWFELNGLRHTSSATAALIIAAIPVLTLVTGSILHRKRQGLAAWAGAAVSLFGVYLVVSSGGEGDSFAGVLYMLGACACWVAYSEITQVLLQRIDNFTLTFWQSVFAAAMFFPLCLTENVPWTDMPLSAWLWACVFLGLICSSACYILYNSAIEHLSPEGSALFLNLNPISAAVGGYLLLGEDLSARQIIGGAIILVSLTCAAMVKRPEERGKSA